MKKECPGIILVNSWRLQTSAIKFYEEHFIDTPVFPALHSSWFPGYDSAGPIAGLRRCFQ